MVKGNSDFTFSFGAATGKRARVSTGHASAHLSGWNYGHRRVDATDEAVITSGCDDPIRRPSATSLWPASAIFPRMQVEVEELAIHHQVIEYSFGDRVAQVEFTDSPKGVGLRVTFDSESTYSVEQQRDGWQAILDNFTRHVEATR